jgi:hypothetical protein
MSTEQDSTSGEPDVARPDRNGAQELSLQARQGTPEREGEARSSLLSETQVSPVSLRPPPFYRSNVRVWFAQLEAQFVLARITAASTKYYHCLANLPEDVACLVELDGTPEYNVLKSQVLANFSKSQSERLEEALSTLNLDGLRPSVAVQRLRRSFIDAGMTPDGEVLKHRLLKVLPGPVQTTLAAHKHLELSQFAIIADAVYEVTEAYKPTFAVSPSSGSGSRSKTTLDDDMRPFREGQRPVICRFHVFFGEEAQRCRPWCRWPGKRPSRQTSRRSSPDRSSEN